VVSRQVDLDMHVQDVVTVLEYEDLREVVLVGHSYGGMVITGAADRAPERVAQLVYLDAEAPRMGRASTTYCRQRSGRDTRRRSGWRGTDG